MLQYCYFNLSIAKCRIIISLQPSICQTLNSPLFSNVLLVCHYAKIQFLCQKFASIHVTVSCCKIIVENYARHNKLRQFNFFLFKNLFYFVRSSKHLEWPNSIVAFIEENVNILLNFMPPDSRHLKRTTKAFVKKSLTVLKETVKEKWKGV